MLFERSSHSRDTSPFQTQFIFGQCLKRLLEQVYAIVFAPWRNNSNPSCDVSFGTLETSTPRF
jgi:hypothetical protein